MALTTEGPLEVGIFKLSSMAKPTHEIPWMKENFTKKGFNKKTTEHENLNTEIDKDFSKRLNMN